MNIRSLLPLFVSAVALAVVLGGTFFFRSQGEPTGGDGGDTDNVTAMVATKPVPASLPSSQARVAPTVPGPRAARERVMEQVEERSKMRGEHMARIRELREQSAARFASERVDPAWASVKEKELVEIANRKGFEQAAAKPTRLSMDCRTSMCRLQGEFGTQGQAEDWVMMYMASVGKAMPSSVVSRTQNPDGSTSVEIYGRAR